MKSKLLIHEKITASFLYFILIIGLGYSLNHSFEFLYNSSNNYYVLFATSALMIIMGDYISEPYYTKPVDVITKTFAILLVLASIPIEKQTNFLFYNVFFWSNVVFFFLAIFLTLLSHIEDFSKVRESILFIITKIASPSIIFSILYLLTLFSFFDNNTNEFLILFALWLILVYRMPIETIAKWLVKGFKHLNSKDDLESIGTAIGCDNPFLYQVEVNNEIHQKHSLEKGQLVYLELEKDIGIVGIIFNEKHLLNKKWLSIYILENKNNEPLKINFKTNKLINSKTIYSKNNQMYILGLTNLDLELKELID